MMNGKHDNQHRLSHKEYYWSIIVCCVIITISDITFIISPQKSAASYAKPHIVASIISSPTSSQKVERLDAADAGTDENAEYMQNHIMDAGAALPTDIEPEPNATVKPFSIVEPLPFYCDDSSASPSDIHPLSDWDGCVACSGSIRKEQDAIDFYLAQNAYQCIFDNGSTAMYASLQGYFLGTYQNDGLVHLHTLIRDIPYPYIGSGVFDGSGAVVSMNEKGFWYTGSFFDYGDGALYFDFSINTAFFIEGKEIYSSPDERFLFLGQRNCMIDRSSMIVHELHTAKFHDVPYIDNDGRMILLKNTERYNNFVEREYDDENVYQYYSFANAACFNVMPEFCSNVVYIDPSQCIRKEEIYYVLYDDNGALQRFPRLEIDTNSSINTSHQIDSYWLCGSRTQLYNAMLVPRQQSVNTIFSDFLGAGRISDMSHLDYSGRFLRLSSTNSIYNGNRNDNFVDLLTGKGHYLAVQFDKEHHDLFGYLSAYPYYSQDSIVYNGANGLAESGYTYLIYSIDTKQIRLATMVPYGSAYSEENDLGKLISSSQTASNAAVIAPTSIPLLTAMPTEYNIIQPTEPIVDATDIPLFTPEPTLQPVATDIPLITPTSDAVEDDATIKISASIASTYLRNDNGPTQYTSSQLIDGIEETCWQFRPSDIKKLSDAYVELTLSRASRVQTMRIKNGFWKITKGYDQYTRNSRPKKIEISFLCKGQDDYSDAMTVTLKDDKKREQWQIVDLGIHENIQAIRIRILSVYKGTKFADVAISEIEFE